MKLLALNVDFNHPRIDC